MIEYNLAPALHGGALIGLSAVLLLWLNGRIAGISGILYGLFTRQSDERNWRLLFVIGLILGGVIYQVVTGATLATRTDFPLPVLVVAGLLVGIGSRLGSGCTSGHGVCGISRLSQRSVLATVTFITTAIITVAVVRVISGASL